MHKAWQQPFKDWQYSKGQPSCVDPRAIAHTAITTSSSSSSSSSSSGCLHWQQCHL
jgi:hypothetical protein